MYSVRSAYKLLDSGKQQEQQMNQPSSSTDGIWKQIWKMEVPPKVRVFWWRVIREFLPARQVLHRRHIEPTANCEFCGAPEETIKHVLLECTVAKEFWFQAKQLIGVKIPSLHPVTWARDLLTDICPRRDRAVILCGMWALWMMRNKRRHGEQFMNI